MNVFRETFNWHQFFPHSISLLITSLLFFSIIVLLLLAFIGPFKTNGQKPSDMEVAAREFYFLSVLLYISCFLLITGYILYVFYIFK